MAKILVIDDHPTNLKLVTDLLQWSGYEVASAASAELAQSAIADDRPDLILMDVGLPGMDGLALTRILKKDPETAGIRILAITAFAMRGDEERVLAAGCDGYLSKPVDTRKLAGQVASYLPAPELD